MYLFYCLTAHGRAHDKAHTPFLLDLLQIIDILMESLQIPRARHVVFANHRRSEWLAALPPKVDDLLHHRKDAILFIGRCTTDKNALSDWARSARTWARGKHKRGAHCDSRSRLWPRGTPSTTRAWCRGARPTWSVLDWLVSWSLHNIKRNDVVM